MAKLTSRGLTGSEVRGIKKQLRRTQWAMRAERAAYAFWPLFVVFCLIATFALLGGFEAFGPLAHRVLLGVAGLAVVGALVLGGNRFRAPTDAEISDRLESGDRRRPLTVLQDDLAVGKGTERSESIWQAYRSRARKAAAALRARWPDLRLAHADKWALRLAAPVLLIGALIASRADLPDRIAAASTPGPMTATDAAAAVERDPVAEAWATPPAYTGIGTIYLEKGAVAPVAVPQGSRLTIRVTDAPTEPTLSGGALAGIESFVSLGGGLAEATGLVTGSGDIVVLLGEESLATWTLEMIPDAPPTIGLTEAPASTLTRALELHFEANDDYGVIAAWAEIAPEGHDPEDAKGLPLPIISMGLPLPIRGDGTEVADSTISDLTAHPWAGAEVEVQLYAEDGAEQVGTSGPVAFKLPERIFTVPLAKALVEQRRELALDYGQAFRVLDVLQAVTRRPEELFDDPGAFLTVRTAVRRLAGAVGSETVPDAAPNVVELLWHAALALEDGDLSSALERLRQAQQALREALENGTEEDIRRAMEELRAAMNEYLQQLAQQQRQNPQQQQQGQMDPNQMMSQQDLNDLLDQMQQQAESGLRDEARDMLSELSRMLENMQAAQQQQMQQQGPGQQALQELQEMIQRQRDLSDETFDELRQRRREQQMGQQQGQQRGQQGQQQGQQQPGWGEGEGRGDEHGEQGQQGGPGQQGDMQQGQPGQGGSLAEQQENLRRQLEELSRGIGSNEAAQALEEAVRSMGEARDDLRDGQNSDAVRDQMDALDSLNQGAEALAQEMEDGQGQQNARGNRRGDGQPGNNLEEDPFDRPRGGVDEALDGRRLGPDAYRSKTERARELMQELRRRSAQPSRPQLELEYLDRLMERF